MSILFRARSWIFSHHVRNTDRNPSSFFFINSSHFPSRRDDLQNKSPTTEMKRLYKPMDEEKFLSKSLTEIRQEFRKMPNPPAKDPFAAK